jgi:hypothetical protein
MGGAVSVLSPVSSWLDTDSFSVYLQLILKVCDLDFKEKAFWICYRVSERSLSVRLVPFTYVKGEFYRRRRILKIIWLGQ